MAILKIGTTVGGSQILTSDTSPGWRMVGADYGMREATVIVPNADGVRDVSDNKRRPCTITVSGPFYGGAAWADSSCWVFILACTNATGLIYITGPGGTSHVVTKLQSATMAPRANSHSQWLDVTATFVGYDPSI